MVTQKESRMAVTVRWLGRLLADVVKQPALTFTILLLLHVIH